MRAALDTERECPKLHSESYFIVLVSRSLVSGPLAFVYAMHIHMTSSKNAASLHVPGDCVTAGWQGQMERCRQALHREVTLAMDGKMKLLLPFTSKILTILWLCPNHLHETEEALLLGTNYSSCLGWLESPCSVSRSHSSMFVWNAFVWISCLLPGRRQTIVQIMNIFAIKTRCLHVPKKSQNLISPISYTALKVWIWNFRFLLLSNFINLSFDFLSVIHGLLRSTHFWCYKS